MGEAGISTEIGPNEDKELLERWKRSYLWPTLREQETSISGPEGKTTNFGNFCPEVSHKIFGLFASSLHKYADEIDMASAYRYLQKENAPANDWGWIWASVTPKHYTDCPLYSPLMFQSTQTKVSQGEPKKEGPILDKLNIFGISLNLAPLLRRLEHWWQRWRGNNSLFKLLVIIWFAFIFGMLLMQFPTKVYAGIEEVYVVRIMEDRDKAVIVRKNGEAYLIEKGTGCISLWRYEGKKVLIVSPGSFLGVGSKMLISESTQECHIWNSEVIGEWLTLPKMKQTPPNYPSSNCEDGHWISSVSSDGEIIVLEDRSVWQVDSVDTIDTSLWLPTENIIICGDAMINTDNGEKVRVKRLR